MARAQHAQLHCLGKRASHSAALCQERTCHLTYRSCLSEKTDANYIKRLALKVMLLNMQYSWSFKEHLTYGISGFQVIFQRLSLYSYSIPIYRDLQNELEKLSDKVVTQNACGRTNPYCACTRMTHKLDI